LRLPPEQGADVAASLSAPHRAEGHADHKDARSVRAERRILQRIGLLTLVGALALMLALAAGFADPPRAGGADLASAPTPSMTPSVSPTPESTLTPAPADQPPAPGPSFFDPSQWIPAALTTAFTWIFTSVREALVNFIRPALALDILVQTPAADTYDNPVVLVLWGSRPCRRRRRARPPRPVGRLQRDGA
jgi:hypothetical protein